jgi:hypothetical protein
MMSIYIKESQLLKYTFCTDEVRSVYRIANDPLHLQ